MIGGALVGVLVAIAYGIVLALQFGDSFESDADLRSTVTAVLAIGLPISGVLGAALGWLWWRVIRL